jgi:WD40 repeat protein
LDANVVRVWDTKKGALVATVTPEKPRTGTSALSFSRDGKVLACANFLSADVFHVDAGFRQAGSVAQGGSPVSDVILSADGTRLAVAAASGRSGVWDVGSARQLLRVGEPGQEEPPIISFSSDGKSLAAARSGENITSVWKVP